MHPAFSIIFFTTASGAGYGLIFLAGLGLPLGAVPQTQGFGFVALAIGVILVSAGLMSSLGHLGHPERAWRALSQWRSSWLSREGVMAIITFMPIGVFGIGWAILDSTGLIVMLAGLLSAGLAVITVHCTAMIYGSLKPIPQWRNPMVPVNYQILALASGGLLIHALTRVWGHPGLLVGLVTLVALIVAWLMKRRYWTAIDTEPRTGASTPETATGLGGYGKVSAFEAPHTEENYLLKEMGFQIGRKHSEKLRTLAQIAGFVVPAILVALALLVPGGFGAVFAVLALLSGLFGVAVERWLFFAEATHVVTLYYGQARP